MKTTKTATKWRIRTLIPYRLGGNPGKAETPAAAQGARALHPSPNTQGRRIGELVHRHLAGRKRAPRSHSETGRAIRGGGDALGLRLGPTAAVCRSRVGLHGGQADRSHVRCRAPREQRKRIIHGGRCHAGGWFRDTQVRHAGHIRGGDIEKDVAFMAESDPDINNRIDAVYRTKYRRHGAQWVEPMVAPEARSATIRLTPR